MSVPKRFQQACEASADFIANGGLKLPEDRSQVDKRAWALLADINRHGLCTVDSQSGECSQDGRYKERAYVEGYMLRNRALAFAEALNSTTSFVAFEITRVEHEPKKVPRITMTVQGNNEAHTRTPQLLSATVWDGVRRRAGLGDIPPEKLAFVQAFDPTYCRKAYGKQGLYRSVAAILRQLP